jgi:HK97 family phage portal protein
MTKRDSFLIKAMRRFGLEFRSSLESPQTPLSYPAEWLLDIFNGGRTDAGLRISEMTALQTAAVFQCVTIIANGIATHPLNVYTRSLEDGKSSKKIAYSHPLFDILHSEPNPEMTSSTWRRTMTCHKLLWGNSYAELERDEAGRVIAIWPRNPARTRPVRASEAFKMEGTLYPPGTLVYETYETMGDSQIMEQDETNARFGMRRIVLAEDMLHVPGLSLDGRLGQDVVILAKQAIGLALATEKYGAKFFGNGAIPQGLLGVPGDMSDIQWETLKRSWAEAHGGENQHKTGVLPPGVTYTKTGATPNEGQMIETRDKQVADIARFFNVPPHMVGINADDAGKSTVEQSSIEFKLFCLDPHVVDFEHELKRKLFPNKGLVRNQYVAHFDMKKLMYPDAASRAAIYGSGKQWGYFCTDDIREMEGMNPVEDGSGDKFWIPVNMVDAAMASVHSDAVTDGLTDGTLAATPSNVTPIGKHPVALAGEAEQNKDNKDGSQGGSAVPKNSMTTKRNKIAKVFGPLFRDAAGRASARNKPNVADYATIFGSLIPAITKYVEVMELPLSDAANQTTFIRDYSTLLFNRRSASWGNLDNTSATELDDLIKLLTENK